MPTEIEADIQRLDDGIRTLKVQYDQFFSGVLPQPPRQLRAELEHLIRRHSSAPIQNLAHRFHFSSLVGRFNAYAELWEKLQRAKEEGRGSLVAPPGRSAAAAAAEAAPARRVLGQQLLAGEAGEAGALRELYDRYVEARRSQGDSADGMSYKAFSSVVRRSAEAVKNRARCDAVRLRLTLDGDRLSVRASPVRRRKTS